MPWCLVYLGLWFLSASAHPVLWVGGVTSNQASFRAVGYYNFTFAVSLNEDLSEPGYSQLLTSSTALITVNSLKPLTLYYYGFDGGDKGSFHTFGVGRYSFKVLTSLLEVHPKIGFGSCAATGSSSQVWSDLRKENLHLFIHMGDLHYNNINEDNVTRFHDSYQEVFDGEEQRKFYYSTPIAYIWDDHDYGENNAGAESLSRLSALQAYPMNVPHYPLPNYASGKGNIGQAFTVGAVRFLMPDLRSEAYPFHPESSEKQGQVMSKKQMNWLLSELSQFDSYSLVVLVSSRHWIGEGEEGKEPWYGFPQDRKLLANFIADKNITNLVMLAGSTHMLAFDDGSNGDYSDRGGAGFPVFQAAPLDRWGSTKGGPFTHGCYSRLGDYNEQYGIMEVIDNPTSNKTCIHFTGRRVNEGLVVGSPGNSTCAIDIMPPWAWVAYAFSTASILLLFILCMIGYFTYITSLTKKRRTLISMFVFIGLFPLVRMLEANTAYRPSYLPVHSAYVLMALAGVYICIVTFLWDNRYQTPTATSKDSDSDVVALSDYSEDDKVTEEPNQ